jgi:drug/metabolite transporter (DMT)-like permease
MDLCLHAHARFLSNQFLVAVRNNGGVNEYLGMLGFFAATICLIQTLIWERSDIDDFFGSGDPSKTCSQTTARLLLFGYVCAVSTIYMGVARFLLVSEATFLNLSFLTGDLWSVTFSVVAEHIVPKPLFFVALAFIVSGVFVYELAPSPILEVREHLDSKDGSWGEGDLNEVELQVQNGNHPIEHAEGHDFRIIE